jgi:DNA helicase MCM8
MLPTTLLVFLFPLGLFCSCISKSHGNAGRDKSANDSDEQFTEKDLRIFHDIASSEDIFALLCHSLCPAIYGHEIVKAGLCLGLLGGTPYKHSGESVPIFTRTDIHVLMVGDPGLGKSQMLKSVCSAAPRGLYVCGNSTSSTGLTVTLVKESGSGDFSLEAGALVLADQGRPLRLQAAFLLKPC